VYGEVLREWVFPEISQALCSDPNFGNMPLQGPVSLVWNLGNVPLTKVEFEANIFLQHLAPQKNPHFYSPSFIMTPYTKLPG
jgi:hypothetical protein